ncbi:serine protease persephone-like [Eurosta solidaginis]|uniref:serine protease persephone-like n=1 Tax=Eurosta solidaginis TaxID=178769 RepID=UPI003531480A
MRKEECSLSTKQKVDKNLQRAAKEAVLSVHYSGDVGHKLQRRTWEARFPGELATKATEQTELISLNSSTYPKTCAEIDAKLQPLLTSHVLGGTPVELGQYPHMVAIGLQNDDSTLEYNCGGSLIAKSFVLTAAHCLTTREPPVRVRMGVVNFNDSEQMKNAVEIGVKRTHLHPDYNSSKFYNDIGVVELQSDVEYSTNVYPTCLYTEPENPPNSSKLYVSGWGVIDTLTRDNSNVLLRARQEIVDNSRCNGSYAETGLNRRIPVGIISTQLCAHDRSMTRDASQGDSGGPLIMVVDEAVSKFRIVAVISAGISCGTSTPAIYTRVSSFLDFIESVVWPNL